MRGGTLSAPPLIRFEFESARPQRDYSPASALGIVASIQS